MQRLRRSGFSQSRTPSTWACLWTTGFIALLCLSGCGGKGPRSGVYDWYARGGSFQGGSPSITADDATIVYASPRSGHGDLYQISLPTGIHGPVHQKRLTSTTATEFYPCVSPDGQKIVFVRSEYVGTDLDEGDAGDTLNAAASQSQMAQKTVETVGPSHDNLWMMSHDGTGERQITFEKDCEQSIFSPDGNAVVFLKRENRSTSIWIWDSATSRCFPIPNTDDAQELAFDASGQRILFRGGNAEHPDIFSIRRDGTDKKLIGHGFCPTASTDGQYIAYFGGSYCGDIWIMKRDGSDARLLYRDAGGHELSKERLQFCADNKNLLFLQAPGHTEHEIRLLEIRSSKTRNVASIL